MASMLLIFLFPPVLLLVLKHFLLRVPPPILPPGPHVWQILWNLSLYIKKPHVALFHLAKIYGSLVSFWVGDLLFVVASSPTAAKAILKSQNFSGRALPSVHYHVPGIRDASLVMSEECNDTWKSLRAMGQTYVFSTKAIESNALKRIAKVSEMVDYLRSKVGQAVNMEEVVMATVINIISNVMASRDLVSTGLVRESGRKLISFIEEVIEKAFSIGLTDMYPVVGKIDFWSEKRALDIYRKIQLVWGDIIKERRNTCHTAGNRDSNRDLLDALAESGLPDDKIAIHLMELLMASTDSTTTTIIWLMAELMRNQQLFLKIRDEIADKAAEGCNLNESRLSECQYLNVCIKETLRLHVAGPLGIPHRSLEVCRVDDYVIPKNSVVLVNMWAIHVDPGNWEDPKSFKPERFSDSKVDFKGNDFQYIPFGAGQRMCPGMHAAMKVVRLIVASWVHYFDWSLHDRVQPNVVNLDDKFSTTLKKMTPLVLISKIRSE